MLLMAVVSLNFADFPLQPRFVRSLHRLMLLQSLLDEITRIAADIK